MTSGFLIAQCLLPHNNSWGLRHRTFELTLPRSQEAQTVLRPGRIWLCRMFTRTIFLMGAPTSSTLNWNRDELLDRPVPPFHAPGVFNQHRSPSAESSSVRWRSLQGEKDPGQFKGTTPHGEDTVFLTTENFGATDEKAMGRLNGPARSHFYSLSFAVHETSEVSHPGIASEGSMSESGLGANSTAISIETSDSDGQNESSIELPLVGGLTDLKDIPSARYLTSIIPQTMTVNLIVGVITIYPPRRIVTRQWKKELDIVEMVVADGTRTGFNVTFWLSPVPGRRTVRHDDSLGRSLAGLRPRDIALLRNVGLSSFQERVYGQSLRQGMTQVDLLHRQRVDASDSGGIYSLRQVNSAQPDNQPVMKVRKVREWMRRFVENDGGIMRHPLPPDTQ